MVSHAVNGNDPTGVSWTADTGAGALGRHGSEALNSSEVEALGCGKEQQNREPDLREPEHGWK